MKKLIIVTFVYSLLFFATLFIVLIKNIKNITAIIESIAKAPIKISLKFVRLILVSKIRLSIFELKASAIKSNTNTITDFFIIYLSMICEIFSYILIALFTSFSFIFFVLYLHFSNNFVSSAKLFIISSFSFFSTMFSISQCVNESL